MAKKKNVAVDEGMNTDGNRAINKFRISDAVMMLILVILCATCVLPFIHLLAKSISGNAYVIAKQVAFWPKGINFDAYASIFKDGGMVYSMIYSVIVTVIFTALGMAVCTCAAYPLSKKRLKGRTFFTFLLMFPMYFSAGLIPSYLLYKDLHILWKIVLPLSKPIIATLSLFYAVGRWNSYADNKYYIKSETLKMIQYKLSQLVSSAAEAQTATLSEAAAVTSTPEVLQAAAIMFVTIPIICIYPFLQKYFVKGLTVGSVKG